MCKYREEYFINESTEIKLLYIVSKYSNEIIKHDEEHTIYNILERFIEELRQSINADKIFIAKKYNNKNASIFLDTPKNTESRITLNEIEDILENDERISDDLYIIKHVDGGTYTYFIGPLFVRTRLWGLMCIETKYKLSDFECEGLASITNLINTSIERMLYEKKIKEKEKFIKSICDNIPDYIWLKDPTGKYMFTNKSFREFLETKDEKEPIGKVYEYFYNKKKQKYEKQDFDPEKHKLIDNQVFDNKENIQYQDSGYDKDKFTVLDIFKTPFFINEDEKGIVSHASNITEQIVLQRSLYERDTLLKVITDQIPSIMFVRDTDGNILYANKKFLNSVFFETKQKFKNIIGKNISDLFINDKDFINDLKEYDMEVIDTAKEKEIVLLKTTPSGKKYWFGCINVPLKTKTEIFGVLTFGKDITEKVESVEEFKNKFNSLSSKYISKHLIENEKIKEEMIKIRNNVQSMKFLNGGR